MLLFSRCDHISLWELVTCCYFMARKNVLFLFFLNHKRKNCTQTSLLVESPMITEDIQQKVPGCVSNVHNTFILKVFYKQDLMSIKESRVMVIQHHNVCWVSYCSSIYMILKNNE